MTASDHGSPPSQRDRILDTALGLMSAHGLAGMSMRMLANECDLNVAALYHYFPSKAELFRSVIENQQYAERLSEVPPFVESQGDRGRLVAFLCEILSGAISEERIWRLLVGESVRGNDLAIEQATSLLQLARDGLSGWISEHMAHLEDEDGTLAFLLSGQMLSVLLEWMLHPGGAGDPDVLAISERIADAVLPRRAG